MSKAKLPAFFSTLNRDTHNEVLGGLRNAGVVPSERIYIFRGCTTFEVSVPDSDRARAIRMLTEIRSGWANATSKPDPIAKIAQEFLDLETLETRNSDRLDFSEQSVWQLRKALEAAYAAGVAAGGKK